MIDEADERPKNEHMPSPVAELPMSIILSMIDCKANIKITKPSAMVAEDEEEIDIDLNAPETEEAAIKIQVWMDRFFRVATSELLINFSLLGCL